MEKEVILGIDSSGTVASAAIYADNVVVAEYSLNNKLTHSQTLLPMIDEIISRAEMDIKEITAIAIASGPGSFTGLRIGASTAKGIGMVLKAPVIPVPTLEGLAFQMYGTDRLICPIMDARRNQVYTGLYEFTKNENGNLMKAENFHVVMEQEAKDIRQQIAVINQLGREVIFLGDGVPVYKEIICQEVTTGYLFAPAFASRQRAAAVAVLGASYYHMGKKESAAKHKPEYLRVSQAEREREKRLKEENSQKEMQKA